jgi:hypothetical protein
LSRPRVFRMRCQFTLGELHAASLLSCSRPSDR